MENTEMLKAETLKGNKIARVRYLGFQQGFGAFPGFELYNIVAGDGLCIGSTVTLLSLLKRGYLPEVVE